MKDIPYPEGLQHLFSVPGMAESSPRPQGQVRTAQEDIKQASAELVTSFSTDQNTPSQKTDCPAIQSHAADCAREEQVASEEGAAAAHQNAVSLQPNVWDAAWLMWTPAASSDKSAQLAVLLGLNITIQLIFTYIVLTSDLAEPQYDESHVDEFRSWRLNVAHHVNYYNALTKQSVAQRVCEGDQGLETSTNQLLAVELFERYLIPADNPILGPLLATVALFVWISTVVVEMRAATELLGAVYHKPWGDHTVLDLQTSVFQQLSTTRAVVLVLMLIVRLGVCVVLLWWGSLFIAYTISLSDLLLNVVALEVIFNTDELLFRAFSPLPEDTIEDIKPLEIIERVASMRILQAYVLTACFVGIVVGTVLVPQIGVLQDCMDAICGGNLNFVITVDGFGVLAWSPLPVGKAFAEYGWPTLIWGFDELSFVQIVVDRVLRRPFEEECPMSGCINSTALGTGGISPPFPHSVQAECCMPQQTKVPEVRGGVFSVYTRSQQTIDEASALWNPFCQDALDATSWIQNLIKGAAADAVRNESCGGCTVDQPVCNRGQCVEAVCANIEHFCHLGSEGGVRTRQLCPVTCNCTQPRSDMALLDGCPSKCKLTAQYKSELQNLECADVPSDDPTFLRFLDNMELAAGSWPLNWKDSAHLLVANFRKSGCRYLTIQEGDPELIPGSFHASWGGNDVCYDQSSSVSFSSYWPIRSFASFCPVSCNCTSGSNDLNCPATCM